MSDVKDIMLGEQITKKYLKKANSKKNTKKIIFDNKLIKPILEKLGISLDNQDIVEKVLEGSYAELSLTIKIISKDDFDKSVLAATEITDIENIKIKTKQGDIYDADEVICSRRIEVEVINNLPKEDTLYNKLSELIDDVNNIKNKNDN
ncbi:MAG: hypothetical protein LBH40_02340 [Alphaproteobacteria bacterium]|jgi:hypothetical protein|nr:hypothetical protein [Alphaproteobacteria bacterium]